MRKRFLSILLHHANRTVSSDDFYAIKGDILAKHGKVVGYDVQFIEGKKCFACGGSGIYTGYWDSGEQWHDTCNRCWGGWFKSPTWNVLAKVRLGRYTFHQPKERCYSEADATKYLAEIRGLAHSVFEGYVDHRRTDFGQTAVVILFLLYRKRLRMDFGFGLGWRVSWWRPGAWLNNALWFYHRRGRYTPAAIYRRVAKAAAERFPEWVEASD